MGATQPERHLHAGIIYLCPDCTGTITAQGITWQCSQPHPEREAIQAEAEQNQDIRNHVQFLLQQGKTRSEILVLIWQQQPKTSNRYALLQQIVRETSVSASH